MKTKTFAIRYGTGWITLSFTPKDWGIGIRVRSINIEGWGWYVDITIGPFAAHYGWWRS
ncbi:MAG: hypothetical protein M0P95_17915 [Sulfuritalea sp.]|nr:hypothetical protein [Sulfuritalea sp.]